jgi:hypothetical protein
MRGMEYASIPLNLLNQNYVPLDIRIVWKFKLGKYRILIREEQIEKEKSTTKLAQTDNIKISLA